MNDRRSLNLKLLYSRFETIRTPLVMVIGLRLGLGIIAFFAYILVPQAGDRAFPNPTKYTSDISVFSDRLLGVWGNWDGGWYLRIATQGYQTHPDSQAFFPFYPILTRGLGKLMLGQYLLAGTVISLVMAIVIFILFYLMIRRDYGEQLAERSILYLSVFPTVFFLFAVYTEALFMALILTSFFAARHYRNWWLAGLLGALAAITRGIGIFTIVPLFVEWVSYRLGVINEETGEKAYLFDFKTLRKLPDLNLIALVLPLVTLCGWLLYSQQFLGDALGSLTAHSEWKRAFMMPWMTVIESSRVLFTPNTNGFITIKIDWYQGANLLNLSFFVMGAIVFLYGCWKFVKSQFPLSYLFFFGIGLIVPLINPIYTAPLSSFPRFLLPLFPMFLLWAQACEHRRWLHFLTLYVSLPLLGLLFTLFANGYWIA